MAKSKDLAILILAAGTSSRLGEPKQLLKYKDETLLKIAVKKAFEISNNVFVVLGSEKEKCKEELKEFDVKIIYNENYKNGIGSSISSGIYFTKEFENTMILLCDQPFIPINHLNTLIKFIDNKMIISSIYEGNKNPSVPAIFPKVYYKKLLELNEDFGAKEILKKEKNYSIELLKKYAIDIDTKEDKKLL